MQQLKANWLSIFCAFSGMTIHLSKTESKHELKMKPDGTKYFFSTLTVYDHQWEPTECPIDPNLTTYKYLGVLLDLCCKNNDAFDRQKKKAATMLLTQAGSP
jgi:hypothetical protein